MQVHIKYDAPPTVSQFLDCNEFVRCIVGPVGSGKSSACVLELLRRAKEQKPGEDGIRRSRFAVIRNTYPELRDTTRKTFEQWIPSQLGQWHEQQFSFNLNVADIDSEIMFRALDRPEDVKKLLSLELTGAYINELREIPRHVFEVLQTRLGRYPAKMAGGPTWFGVWADTNPWHSGHWASRLFRSRPKGHAIFHQPGGRAHNAENLQNLPDGYYERLCIGKDTEWVRVYVDGEEASSAIGSVYGELIEALSRRGGVSEFAHPQDGVFTSWDLGISDATAIWWWRINERGSIDIIDWYEEHGKPIAHFFDVIDSKPYEYVKHWLPHDAQARTLVTGSSIQDAFLERYGRDGKLAITPKLEVFDGIAAARWLLEQATRIHNRCADGIETLRAYRYEWSEKNETFSRKPVHDWASNTADAFRYVAVVARNTALAMRRSEPKPTEYARAPSSFTLDELWDINESKSSREHW